MSRLSILVVEDDGNKRQQIVSTIAGAEPSAAISEAGCIIEARRFLSDHRYDLAILDIALPTYTGGELVRDAGASLLREVMDYDLYAHPRYVIGITGYDDLSVLFADDFRDRFWRLLSTSSGEDWPALLTNFVRHLSRVVGDAQKVSLVDLCLLTALADPELDAVLALPWAWQEPIQLDESTYYRLGECRTTAGRSVSVAATSALRMGPVSASILASKFVSALRPRALGMAGICAGVRGAAELGDIIGASEVWSWESGKLLGSGGRPFAPEPVSIAVNEPVVAALQQMRADRGWLDALRAAYPGPRPTQSLQVRVAPIACGTPVVADTEVVSRICGVNRKTAAIEMESFGIMMAGRAWLGGGLTSFCVKSVCDFADEHKDDSWRSYAAYTSAHAVERLITRYGDVLIAPN